MEAALLEINSERLSLAASMKDVDSATKRLDNILMTLYILVVALIFAIMLVRILFWEILGRPNAQVADLRCRMHRFLRWSLALELSFSVCLGSLVVLCRKASAACNWLSEEQH